MGTNYYLYEKPPCPCCKREYPELHIGKSSGGWCFSLHIYPEEGINDLKDWKILWVKQDAVIKDEYGKEISPVAMLDIIKNREWVDRLISSEWYEENQAEPGPNGLARSKVDGRRCIGHGKGTWDLFVGEFS